MPAPAVTSVEEKARRKGRAYQCLRCAKRGGKQMVDVKYRVEDHILRVHLSLDEVPFYCNLCLFRCTDEKDLQQHVKTYRKHQLMAADDPERAKQAYLRQNSSPHIIGTEDYRVMSQEESRQHWLSVLQKKQPQDTLQEAINQVFDRGLPATTLSLPSTAASQMAAVAAPVPAYKPACAPEASTQQSPLWPTDFLVNQLQTLTDQTRQLLAARSEQEKAAQVSSWVASLPVQPVVQGDEDILPEILGSGSACETFITPKRKAVDVVLATTPEKRARMPSPDPSSSTSSQSTSSAIVKAVREEGAATRALMSGVLESQRDIMAGLKTAMDKQAEATSKLAEVLQQMSSSMLKSGSRQQTDDRDAGNRNRPLAVRAPISRDRFWIGRRDNSRDRGRQNARREPRRDDSHRRQEKENQPKISSVLAEKTSDRNK